LTYKYTILRRLNKNDKLALLYKSNNKNLVAINTAVGLTERVDIPNIVQQGGTWGPGLCSNSIDTLGKKCQKQDIHNYLYKGKTKVLIFAMCDDLNGVARCGIESVALNTFITTQIELKKLRFHIPDINGKSKCHKIHVGKNHDTCPVLKVHGTEMESVAHDTYLGDIISSDGRNSKNIKKRISKGIGISTQIVNLLSSICLGEYYMEIAMLLRESMFINGILTNAEIWYSVTKEEIREFEDLDRTLLMKILKVPFSTPGEAFYLELGILPIGVILKARRANYMHYLLKRKENEMLHTFFITQWFNETVGDWTEQLKIDLADLGIPCDFDFIRSKSSTVFKEMVKRKSKEYALNLLREKQVKH
jgi:3-deoxy-D-manno-octulosonate 8-phosphate phosphatase KdsC-like HAD superfamily phosphatase